MLALAGLIEITGLDFTKIFIGALVLEQPLELVTFTV